MCYPASLPPSYSMSSLPPWFINCNDRIASHQSGKSQSPGEGGRVGGSQSFVIALVNIWLHSASRSCSTNTHTARLTDWLDHQFIWKWVLLMLIKWDLTQSGSRDQISTKQMTWPWIIEQGKNTKDMSMNITSVEDKNIRSLALLITILVAAIHNIILAYFDWQFYITQRGVSLLIRARPPNCIEKKKVKMENSQIKNN